MEAKPVPGLEHLPFAEVWLNEAGDETWAEASRAAAAIDKAALEVWTTTRTPDVAEWLCAHGFEEVRRYAISALDVAAADDPGEPRFEVVTLADRPELADELFALAQVAYSDQPGRAGSQIAGWHEWGLRAHPPEAYFVALEDGRVLGYGYLEHGAEGWRNGFMAVARDARGRGVAGAIKRAQIRWAKANGVERLETANEARLEGMLALNRRLGYRLLYEEIVLRGPLRPT